MNPFRNNKIIQILDLVLAAVMVLDPLTLSLFSSLPGLAGLGGDDAMSIGFVAELGDVLCHYVVEHLDP